MSEQKIYIGADGRARIYVKDNGSVVSYPKFIMEHEIGRKLLPDEQVHHIDGNPLNNEINNLEIRLLGEHQKEHSTKYYDKIECCEWCGKEFLWTAKQQLDFNRNRNRKNRKHIERPFCSKKCTGEYGKYMQLKNNNIN